MSKQNGFVEYVKDILEPFGPLRIKPMFGGYGIYSNEVFFAIIAYNELYFKGEKGELNDYYESQNSEPFKYDGKGKEVIMSYWKVPGEVMEYNESLAKWFELSYNAAIQSKRKKK